MVDSLHAMTGMRRQNKQTVATLMNDGIAEQRYKNKLERIEQMEMLEKGLPQAMAMWAVKEAEKKKTDYSKEAAFLNDVLHPQSVYEPFSFTAMKAATKYFTNK